MESYYYCLAETFKQSFMLNKQLLECRSVGNFVCPCKNFFRHGININSQSGKWTSVLPDLYPAGPWNHRNLHSPCHCRCLPSRHRSYSCSCPSRWFPWPGPRGLYLDWGPQRPCWRTDDSGLDIHLMWRWKNGNDGLKYSNKKCILTEIAVILSKPLGPLKVSWVFKTLDTIGNCQRLIFSLGVSPHMHEATNLWKFELNWSSKLRENNERKNTLVTRSCLLTDAWLRDLNI